MSRSNLVATQRQNCLGMHPSLGRLDHSPYSFAARTSLESEDATALLLFIPQQWTGCGQSVAVEGWLSKGGQKMCCTRTGLNLLLSSSKEAV